MKARTNRLQTGGRIDRTRPLHFSFDGHQLIGLEGDTLASALLANGINLIGRSFKYHRPRGILGAGVEEPNAIVGIDRDRGRGDVNVRATTLPLFDGLRARSQNRWPCLRFDLGALADVISPILPAGFYYKTFMWPPSGWRRLYEPAIRAMAGLGRVSAESDPDCYGHRYAHCDVLIVGGGPAGMAAALAASNDGQRVILCDEQEEFGGTLLTDFGQTIDGLPAWQWLVRTLTFLAARPNLRLLPRTTAFGYYAQNLLGLAERLGPGSRLRERQWQVRAGRVILATGAIERPLVFPGNDRPGIMLAGAVTTYVHRYGVLPGHCAAIVLNHDSGYQAAFDAMRAGIEVSVIVDLRSEAPQDLHATALALGVEVISNVSVRATRGRLRLEAICVDRGDGAVRWVQCDLLMMAGGWTPSVHLFSQSRGTLTWSESAQAHVPATAAQATHTVGSCRGVFNLRDCLEDGWIVGGGRGAPPTAVHGRQDCGAISPIAGGEGKAFVDFQNDVTAKDIHMAVNEGFTSVEHIKRYTTNGMATDQGRTSNQNAIAIAAQRLGVAIPQVGVTSFRAPYTPTTFGSFAGPNRGSIFDPARLTPTHDWAVAHGAVFEDVGLWKRARYFPQGSEDMGTAVRRECRETRRSVGMFDASTLGKIEVVGPDAAEFMNRVYVNAWTKLEIGRCRYGVMLREDGFVMDDGVVGRIAIDRFHVTTTTGGAPRVLHVMEDYLQTEFPELKVWLTSTTEQWAVIALNGPCSRRVLAPLVEGLDITRDMVPHMSVRIGRICGVPMRLFRVSFTGELGFEINIPAGHAQAVWETVHGEVSRHGGVVYGTEAMHVMRAEKGYIIIGQETDGTQTLEDLGLGWTVGKAKRDFVGKRALARTGMTGAGRKQLVGLRTCDRRTTLEEGAQLTGTPTDRCAIGHVTSAYWSEELGEPIALALLADGRDRYDQTCYVAMPGGAIPVLITKPIFIDPEGSRLDV